VTPEPDATEARSAATVSGACEHTDGMKRARPRTHLWPPGEGAAHQHAAACASGPRYTLP